MRFLSVSQVLEIHRDQITRYGGGAGIRDMGLLLSALGMPQASFGGTHLHADLKEMAAAYLFHIVSNHPFIDGNKRTGAVAALVFLLMNGHECTAPEEELYEIVMAVARAERSKSHVALFFEQWTIPKP